MFDGRCTAVMTRLNRVLTLVASALTALFFVLICAQVVARYVLSYSITWSEEISRYAFVWATFLGAAAVAGVGEHYAVIVVDSALPPRGRLGIGIFRGVVEAAFALVVAYFGFKWAARQWSVSTPVVEASQGLVYLIVPLFGVYLAWTVLLRMRRSARSLPDAR